jgi:hypothetical protein
MITDTIKNIEPYASSYRFKIDTYQNQKGIVDPIEGARKKFANFFLGVPASVITALNTVSEFILLEPDLDTVNQEDRFYLAEILTLFAHHVFQHNDPRDNALLSPENKEKTMRLWASAAIKLAPKMPKMTLETDLALSQWLQIMFYYEKVSFKYLDEQDKKNKTTVRLDLFNQMMGAIHYLAERDDKTDDIYAFKDRLTTLQLRHLFIEKSLGKYEKAISHYQSYSLNPHLDEFNAIQFALVISDCYLKLIPPESSKAEDLINNALEKAIILKHKENNLLLEFNCLMKKLDLYDLVKESPKALQLAEDLMATYEKNPKCGLKLDQVKRIKEVSNQHQVKIQSPSSNSFFSSGKTEETAPKKESELSNTF